MAGYVGFLDAETLRPLHSQLPPPQTTNGVRADVIDGILWISQPDGGPSRNYCAQPAGGQPRLAMPLAVQRGEFLTADSSRIYYLNAVGAGSLFSAPIPAACR
jgi:hypothetical protein